VLERVIKARYETLSKNFAETSATLENLAHESIKEKKKRKKMVKDYNSLWWLARHLKKKVKLLKLRSMPAISQPQTFVDLQTLENAASHIVTPCFPQSVKITILAKNYGKHKRCECLI
jgi:hypothetical protein